MGIGTSSPEELLHVLGSANAFLKAESTSNASTGIKLENTSGEVQLVLNASNVLAVNDIGGSGTRLYIEAAGGNIGIGNFFEPSN